MPTPRFQIGQIVRHKKFNYRGVVVDADLEFSLSDDWYDHVARSRPPKDQPWYRVLVGDSRNETYVAERHLEADDSGTPVEHPRLEKFFDSFHGNHYSRSRNLN